MYNMYHVRSAIKKIYELMHNTCSVLLLASAVQVNKDLHELLGC